MNAPELCVRRPVMTTLGMLGVMLFGIMAYRLLPVSDPRSLVISADRGLFSYYQRDYEPAVQYYRQTLAMEPDFAQAWPGLGYAYGLAGKKSEARAVLDDLLALARRRYVSSYYVAGVFIGLGDRDRAFEWLGRACDERASLLGALKVDPGFDPLRSDFRFAALLARAGLAK